MKKNSTGFTLIEISIVLVIIGLIVGGIMLGQTLIRSSELRSIVTDIEKFEAARITFRSKYNCVAGDCQSASAFGLGTNGNGNGYVDHYNSYVGDEEVWQFWKHLANAGLIKGNYTGVGGLADPDIDSVIEENVPSSRISGVGYSIYTAAPLFSDWSPSQVGSGVTRSVYDSKYYIGRDERADNYLTRSGFLNPIEAKSLDEKYDDGLANKGNIRVELGSALDNTNGCTSGAAPNYSYTNNSAVLCNMLSFFRN